MKHATAKLEWRNHQPYSTEYDDVYFSSEDGLAESEYVFIQGNQLDERWQIESTNNRFTIIETGFGTGLNFCCATKRWLSTASEGSLHFISVEKHPLSAEALEKALSRWPTLANIKSSLLSQYKTLNLHGTLDKVSLVVLPSVTLTLYFGDVIHQLARISEKADAWFLDGFAPSKNPSMWQPAVFRQMAALSKPTTTLATFTSAGVVRRGLSEAGFKIQKRAGFGKKREMLTGQWQGVL